MAQILGAFLGVWLFSKLFEFIIFKRVFDDPVKGKVGAVLFTYLFASVVAGFGMANGQAPVFGYTFLLYLPASVVLAFLAYRKGLELREMQPVDDTFA